MKRNFFCHLLFGFMLIFSFAFTDLSYAEENFQQIQNKEKKKVKITRFNTGFIKEFNKNIDLSWLENESGIQPGRYGLEIFLNGKNLRTHYVEFVIEKGVVTPCISQKILERISFNEQHIPFFSPEQQCINLTEKLPGSLATYDDENERLILTIPQIYLQQHAEGYIDPSRWDEGINALSASYSLSGSNSMVSKNASQSQLYGNLQTTLRLGTWRFYTYDSMMTGKQQNRKIQHLQSYAQRAIGPLLSELSLGDLNTTGELFDTTSLRGVVLKSDERMLPWTVKGYAPEVRGIANSNAIVTIRQNGNVIYEQNVPPGEFKISNIAALGYGGNLDVMVTESNGVVRTFQIPYSSIPQLLRKGYFRYSVAAGKVRRAGIDTLPSLLESTLQYGLSNNITLYGGLQSVFDKSYNALNTGLAFNTPYGALSTDITHSLLPEKYKNEKRDSLLDSSRLKVGYSKLLNQTKTNFNIASYYIAGENFYSLDEILRARSTPSNKVWNDTDRYRNKFELVITQDLIDDWGQLALSGWWEKNNKNSGNNTRSSYLFSYKNNYESLNYSLSLNKTFTYEGKEDTTLILNMSMPFGFKKVSRPNLRVSMSYNNSDATLRSSLSGSSQRESSSTSFNTYMSQSSRKGPNFGINVGNSSRTLQKSISYSQTLNSSSLAGSINGGVLLHSDGIQFSSYIGETIALVEAKSAEGASIKGNRNSSIGKDGFGIFSYLTPYEENTFNLDLTGAPVGFEPEEDGLTVVPTSGAVIKVKFNNKNTGHRSVIARVKKDDGGFIPFASRIYDEGNNISGTSGQGGITIISLPEKTQSLDVRWLEDGVNISCKITKSDLEKSIVLIGEGRSTAELICNRR